MHGHPSESEGVGGQGAVVVCSVKAVGGSPDGVGVGHVNAGDLGLSPEAIEGGFGQGVEALSGVVPVLV